MSWAETSVQVRCVGRFAVLHDHFAGLLYRDLAKLDEETILATVPMGVRLLAAVLVREVKDDIARLEEAFGGPNIVVTDTGTLAARGRVLSSNLSVTTLDRLPVQSLHLAVPEAELARVTAIDVAASSLFGEDLEHLLAELEWFPNCAQLDLSDNRIYASPEAAFDHLQSILRRGVMVVVTGNPFIATARPSLFARFTAEELDRLIWIPRAWMGGSGWRTFAQSEHLDRIFEAHKAWYARPTFDVKQ